MEPTISLENSEALAKARTLEFGNTINRAIWKNLVARGLYSGNPTVSADQQYTESKIMAMERDIPKFLTTFGLWPVVEQLAQNGELLRQAERLGINVNQLVWQAVQKTGNPVGYSKSQILNMKVDTPLFLIDYNLWPELQKLIFTGYARNWEKSTGMSGDIVGLIELINRGLPNEVILNTVLVGYDYDRIIGICKSITGAINRSDVITPTKQKLQQLNSLICTPNSYFWRIKIEQDFGIVTKPDTSTWREEYQSYLQLPNVNRRLIRAVQTSQLGGVRRFLSQGADVNASGDDDVNVLMYASYAGNPEVVELLIIKGADVNASDDDGRTPLMYASKNGNSKVVQLLIIKGADVNASNSRRETALMYASKRGNLDVVKLLIANKANINATNSIGGSVLGYAIRNLEVAKLLIDKGVNVNSSNNSGLTSLMTASNRGKLNQVKFLVENGATVDLNDNFGLTALMHACRNGNLEVAKFLILKGADVNLSSNTGRTPLMYAAGNSKLQALLRSYGAT